jgi:hypothetical protein
MSEVERNLKLVELGYMAKSQGLDLDSIKAAIIELHGN